MTGVAALLLCAGKSSRMEGENKLLMRFDSESVLSRTAGQVTRAQFLEIVAVTGHDRLKIESEIKPYAERIRPIHNDSFDVGMHSSIRKGLEALETKAEFFAVCLADQPLLTVRDYDHLIRAASLMLEVQPSTLLISPRYSGVRGTPTLISMKLREEILAHEDSDRGCHYLFERYPDEVAFVDMPFAASPLDVDTREMLERARSAAQASPPSLLEVYL